MWGLRYIICYRIITYNRASKDYKKGLILVPVGHEAKIINVYRFFTVIIIMIEDCKKGFILVPVGHGAKYKRLKICYFYYYDKTTFNSFIFFSLRRRSHSIS